MTVTPYGVYGRVVKKTVRIMDIYDCFVKTQVNEKTNNSSSSSDNTPNGMYQEPVLQVRSILLPILSRGFRKIFQPLRRANR